MSTTTLHRRLDKLLESAQRGTDGHSGTGLHQLDPVLRHPGVLDRLWRIAEYGASPDDLEWLDRQSTETGFDFRDAVAACVKLNEEY